MYKRTHHQQIATILAYLNPLYLMEHQCFFGGGTAIALRYGEFRESVDIDFLISDIGLYGKVRNDIRDHHDLSPLLLPGKTLELIRELRTDQYGIRTVIGIGEAKIKLEIISEGRISFDLPEPKEFIDGIPSLTRLDSIASKLLVNSDRYADDSVYSRDLIDLAMIKPTKKSRIILKPRHMNRRKNEKIFSGIPSPSACGTDCWCGLRSCGKSPYPAIASHFDGASTFSA